VIRGDKTIIGRVTVADVAELLAGLFSAAVALTLLAMFG